MKTSLTASFALLLLSAGAAFAQTGYTNTPFLPGSPWRVHDDARPRPPVVTPGAPQLPVPPPSDAIVLFDGKDLSNWVGDSTNPVNWKVENGYMEVGGKGGIKTTQEFGDAQIHIEWATPEVIKGESQGRGNSGVFIMGRYELQVLDSWENKTYADGQAGAIYAQRPPMVNASRKPGEWQSYDIAWTAPRFAADGKLESPAKITVFHNGVCVQAHTELIGGATHKQVAKYSAHGPTGPLGLQNHNNPMRFRNIWVRPLKLAE